MDLLYWFAGAGCRKLSSFGSLTHFRKEDAPPGSPLRCLDGCPHEKACPYYAPKIYLTADAGWPASVISTEKTIEARLEALTSGPYGRCVYHCDNDVVDHQVASFEFENEVTAAFTMCAFSEDVGRTIKLMGTRGVIRGSMGKNEIEVYDFQSGRVDLIQPPSSKYRYGGGDYGIMDYFVNLARSDGDEEGLTSASASLESHLMAFAAEKSRLESRTVHMEDYRSSLRAAASSKA
jgi:predicted dehydrogenase